MKHIILFILLINTFVSFAQKDTIIDGKHYNIIEYYSSGKIKEIGNISDKGKKVGECICFDNSGRIISKGKYKNNKKHGYWTDENGYGKYIRGKKYGWWNNLVNAKIKYFCDRERKIIYINYNY